MLKIDGKRVFAKIFVVMILVGMAAPPVVAQPMAGTASVTPTSTSDATAQAPSASKGNKERGSLYFMTFGCQSCHGYDGRNPTGHKRTVIVDPKYLASKTDDELASIIRKGFRPPYYMKAYRKTISQQQMSDLLAWMRSHKR
jgi:mono/diheme cytochrome c family protein